MRVFRLTHPIGGSLEVIPSFFEEKYCFNEDGSIKHDEIAHLGWRKLFDNKDSARVLMNVIDRIGVDEAKRQYTKQITIEEVK